MARRALVLALAVTALVAGLLGTASVPATSLEKEPFVPGQAYSGAFADPTIIRLGNQYFAHATTTAQLSMPILSSTDLRTWTARPASDPATPWSQDGLSQPAAWATTQTRADGSTYVGSWAPSVAWIPGGGYVAAYAVPNAYTGRRCISVARSSSPMGPFVDATTTALTCGFAGTAIDPQLFRDAGKLYLLFKSKGTPNLLVMRQMDSSGTAFAPGTGWHVLMAAKAGWEGGVVENPAMVRYRKKLYLFYSGNAFDSTRYATGYAQCRTVYGPCQRKGLLLASNYALSGPGGATPFTDTAGALRLGYHAFRTSEAPYLSSASCRSNNVGCPARRLYVATLAPGRHKGRLVVRRYW